MIKFEIPANDTIALNAIGAALQIMAQNRPVVSVTETSTVGDVSQVIKKVTGDGMVTETTAGGVGSFKESVTSGSGAVETDGDDETKGDPKPPSMAEGAAIVAGNCGPNGVRWDARIHSRTKTIDANGNFKNKKHPKAQFPDKADWLTYLGEIETQLKGATMGSPTGDVSSTTTDNDDDASNVGFGDTNASSVFDKPDGAGDPKPPSLKTDPTPPSLVNATDTDKVITFQDLMKTMTSNKTKITAAQLLGICQTFGIEKVVQVKDQTPEVIAAVYEAMMEVINGG